MKHINLVPIKKFFLNKNFIIQYAVSLLNGVASLLCLTLLGRIYTNTEQYSEVSNIVSLFTAYFVFMDLGYTAEFMRDAQHKPLSEISPEISPDVSEKISKTTTSRAFVSLIWLRWGVALLLLPAAFFQGIGSGLLLNDAFAFVIFAASLFVFAIFATLDSLHLAEGNASKAISVKLIRSLVSVSFPATLMIFPQNRLSLIFSLYLTVSLVFGAVGIYTQRHTLSRAFSSGFFPDAKAFSLFGHRCLKVAATPLFGLLGAFIVQTTLFRGQGLHALATYVAAISLMSPVTTAMQTVNQIVLKDIAHWATHETHAALIRLWKVTLVVAAIGIAGVCGILAFYSLGVVDLFLKHLDSTFTTVLLLVATMQIMAAMQVQFFNFLQFRKRYRTLFISGATVSVVSTFLVSFGSLQFGVWGNLIGSLIAGLAMLTVTTTLAHREK